MADGSSSVSQLGINGYKPRQPFIDFHNRPERWAVMVCHRRAGKTVACVAELVLSALFTRKQDARYAYVGPQLNQVKDVAWLYIKRLTADIPGVQYNETELRADLPNGARIRLYGADNPDRLRGLYLDGVILDEFADMRSSVWGEIIRPMLADRRGWAVFIGTPKGHNEFYSLWHTTETKPEWYRMMLRASESGLVDSAELVDAAASMTEDQYAQEFECSFEAAVAGAFYAREFADIVLEGRICDVPYQPEIPVYTAWDIGRTDDTSIWFYQVLKNELHIIDFHTSNGHDAEFYAGILKDKPYNYAKLGDKPLLWLPHDARAKTFAARGRSVQNQFEDYGFTSLIVPQLSVQDGIQATRLTLKRCYFDAAKTYEGYEALKMYRREWDDEKKVFRATPLHNWASNPADAFRMLSIAWQHDQAPKKPVPVKFDTDRTIDQIIKRQRNKRMAED